MKLKNTAVVGKQTNWMSGRLKYYADTTYSYCFIYGGGNDIAAGVGPRKVYSNISAMVSYCEQLNITPVVITGSDPEVVISPVSNHWKNYIRNKSKLQSLLVDSLQGAYVIDVRDIIEKKDCADFLCHMKKSGHRKISDRILKRMNFQEIHQ
jgi:lysophospholipase L1-like esterase